MLYALVMIISIGTTTSYICAHEEVEPVRLPSFYSCHTHMNVHENFTAEEFQQLTPEQQLQVLAIAKIAQQYYINAIQQEKENQDPLTDIVHTFATYELGSVVPSQVTPEQAAAAQATTATSQKVVASFAQLVVSFYNLILNPKNPAIAGPAIHSIINNIATIGMATYKGVPIRHAELEEITKYVIENAQIVPQA
jgi:hypothetical protein